MKTPLLILSLLTLLVISCSSDNNSNNEEFIDIDPIIGNWQITAIVDNGNELVLFECDLMQELVFDEDGTAESTEPFFNGTNCILTVIPFFWEQADTNLYEFDFDILVTSVVEFSNNNMTLKIIDQSNNLSFTSFSRM